MSKGEQVPPTTIVFQPAECSTDCQDPYCPYVHRDAWYIGVHIFYSEDEARAALSRARL